MKLDKIPEFSKDAANTFTVEEHTGGWGGIGAGPATGCYTTKHEAIEAMASAIARGNGTTCIARDESGGGQLMRLGLIVAERSVKRSFPCKRTTKQRLRH